MNKKTRFLILLLVFAMAIMPLFVTGCKDDDDDGDISEAVDDLPTSFGTTQKNYAGRKFKVLTHEDRNSDQAFNIVDLVPNEDLGDTSIAVAVEARNAKIKSYFGVSIVREKVAQGDLYEKANQLCGQMDDTYSVMRLRLKQALNLALTGMLLDINEQKWIDLSQDWWDEGIIDSLLLYDGAYFGTGDICTVDDDATWVVLFNKELYENRTGNKASYLYDIVESGNGKTGGWTLDVLKSAAQAVHKEELDSSNNIYDKNYSGSGIYGLTVQWAVSDALMVSNNYTVTELDKNDPIKIKEVGQSALTNAVDAVFNFMGGSNYGSAWLFMADDLTGKTNDPYADNIRPMFMDGRCGFFICHVGTIGLIREMEQDFGILPMPKLDTQDMDYGNTVQYDCADCYVIPNTGKDKNAEFAAYILEALAYYSSTEYDERTGDDSSLTYAYYETVLKRKSARDNDSAAMLDLIFDNRIYDIAIALDLKDIASNVIRKGIQGDNVTFASKYTSISSGNGIYNELATQLENIIKNS